MRVVDAVDTLLDVSVAALLALAVDAEDDVELHVEVADKVNVRVGAEDVLEEAEKGRGDETPIA